MFVPCPLTASISASANIVGLQLHTYSHGGVGHNFIKEPQVLGHESAGTITQVGANVTNLKVGDRVAIEPTRFCRK